jgi:protein O-GlcNAc transferase
MPGSYVTDDLSGRQRRYNACLRGFLAGLAALCACALLLAQSPQELADRAEQLIRAGDKDGALSALSQAGQAAPAASQLEDRIGFLYAVLGQGPEALQHFQKSISLDPAYAPAHYHLGVALWQANDREHAVSELKTAAKLGPNVYDYWLRLGTAYSQTGDLAGAVDADAHALELAPSNDAVRNDYAYLLVETRRADKAIEECRKILAHNPTDASALMNIGYAHLKKGEFDAAEDAYRQAVAAGPNSPIAHYDLGIALKMRDQLEAAQNEFKEAMRLDPSLPEAHYSLGIADWQLGDFAGMAGEMRAAIAVRPSYAEAHYMLGIALKQSGDLDGAIAELKQAIQLDPNTPGPYNTLGQVLRIKGDKQASDEAFATGARLKREADAQLAHTLDQGMRGGTFMKPLAGGPR